MAVGLEEPFEHGGGGVGGVELGERGCDEQVFQECGFYELLFR